MSRRCRTTRNVPVTTTAPATENSYMLPHGARPAEIPRVTTPARCSRNASHVRETAMPAAFVHRRAGGAGTSSPGGPAGASSTSAAGPPAGGDGGRGGGPGGPPPPGGAGGAPAPRGPGEGTPPPGGGGAPPGPK